MDGRRHVSVAALSAAVLLGVTLLGPAYPAHARGLPGAPAPAPSAGPAPAASPLAPSTGAEHPVSDLPAQGKVGTAVASDGTVSLVVWSDSLSGLNPQIRFARRDAAGTLLGELVLSPSPAAQTAPSVAFNGTNFFVVWQEAGDLFGTRVTPGGVVLDGYGIPVAISRAEAFSEPAVASDGSGFLVAWIGRDADLADVVFAKRVTGAGAVLDGAGFQVGSAGSFLDAAGNGPAAAYNGTSYLVVWTSDSCPFCGTLLGSRVTTAGSVVNPGGFPISLDSSNQYFNEFAPSVSATGSQFVVAWTAERCTPPADCHLVFDTDVLAGRVSASGTVLGTSNIAVAVNSGFAGQVSVGSTAATSLVVWSDARSGLRDVYGTRVSTAGVITDPSGIKLSANAAPDHDPAVTVAGQAFVAAWAVDIDIVGASVGGAGTVVHPASVVSAGIAPAQSAPDVAWDGNEVVAVWREFRPGMPDTIRVGRAVPDGRPGSGEGTVIASGFDLGDPAIASSGQQQLVVWPQDGRVLGARLEFGNDIDATPIAVSPAAVPSSFPRSPAVAWNGSVYLVTWADDDAGSLDVFAARVDSSATVLDPAGMTIASAVGDQELPAVASDDSDFLVVWHDTRSGPAGNIYGTRISGAGTISNPAGLAISTAAGDQSYPDVAWNGTDYVVVWQDRRGTSLDIYGTRLSAGGVVANPTGVPLSTAATDQSRPTISSSPSQTLVAWEDRRSGSAVDLYGTRLSTAAAVLDPQGVVISSSTSDEVDPASTNLGGGRVVTAYQRLVAGPPYRADRVFLRVTSPK